jgi:hypothetical protein
MKKNRPNWPDNPRVLRDCEPGAHVLVHLGEMGPRVRARVAWHWKSGHVCVRPYSGRYNGDEHITLDGDTPIGILSPGHS